MIVFEGASHHTEAANAIAEATQTWDASFVPEIVFVFASTKQDPHEVAAALTARFPQSVIVGCSTSGEHLSGAHYRGALVMTAIGNSGIRWATTRVDGLSTLDSHRAEGAVEKLFAALDTNVDDFDPSEYFCMSLIDGLRGCEEIVTANIADALEGVKLVGGSAGDDLAFKQTWVISGDRAYTDAVVLVMGHAPPSRSSTDAQPRFQMIKHEHFTTMARRIAITRVDTANRRVYEIDGMRALAAYARALGMEEKDVTDKVTFAHPVAFSCDGEVFIRAIRQIHHEDGSLTFFCGLEEGMVLEIGGHQDLVGSLSSDFNGAMKTSSAVDGAAKPFELLLGYNCILRALEAERDGLVCSVGNAWRGIAKHSIGFDTYGEQLDGQHINQTLVAIGIRSAA